MGRCYQIGRRLRVACFPSAIILPGCGKGGGILSAEGEYQPSSYFYRGATDAHAYAYNRDEVRIIGGEALYLGLINPCWGHCLTDGIKFLWVLFSDGLTDAQKRIIRLVYTTQTPTDKLPANFISILECLGVEESRLVRIDKPTRVAHLYLPDECFWNESGRGRFFTEEYVQLLDRLTLPSPETIQRKVYLTRSNWQGRTNDYGESDVAHYFSSIGFEVISPETLSLDGLREMLGGCAVLAATEGSIAHNAVFLREGTKLILLRKSNWTNDYQVAVNEARKLDVTYVDANRTWLVDPRTPWEGPFFLYVSQGLVQLLGGKSFFPVCKYTVYLSIVIYRKCHRLLRIVYAKMRAALK